VSTERRICAWLLLLVVMIAVYGSLVPLHYRALPFDVALDEFSRIPFLNLGVHSRADFVSNILLFVPAGFFAMGVLRPAGGGPVLAALAAALIAMAAATLSLGIEFVQLYFPPRTVSLNDVIAETSGACAGAVLWIVAGPALARAARGILTERERPALAVRLLGAYAGAFLIAQLLPLDLTIDPGELATKFREGRVLVVPFAHHYASAADAFWDLAADVVLHLPIGALAVLGWTRRGTRRAWPMAFALGIVAVSFVEAAQLLVFTRVSDVTDVLLGGAGVALGAAAVRGRGTRTVVTDESRWRLAAAAAAVVWTGVIVTYHWYPFDFVVTGDMFRSRVPVFLAAPFASYYAGSEFHAFTEITRKLILALPLGSLIELAAGPRRTGSWAVTAALLALPLAALVVIEAGQMFLPTRVPDLTDALVGTCGAALGVVLVRRFAALPAPATEAQIS
jgi:VanZ family protein